MHGSATAENLLLNVSNVTPTLQPTDEAARTLLFCWGKTHNIRRISSGNAERSGRLQSSRPDLPRGDELSTPSSSGGLVLST